MLSTAVLGWVLALFLDIHFHPQDFLPPLPLGSTAIGALALPFGWLVREERLTVREKRARQREVFPPMEVIPIERFSKSSGSNPRSAPHRVVIVRKHRVRRVQPPSPCHARRKALGLGTHRLRNCNRQRDRGWYRRFVW